MLERHESKHSAAYLLSACAAMMLAAGLSHAQVAPEMPPLLVAQRSLADLSLEQLTSIEVTSVAKRVQRLADVAGSVFVIHNEDIRRSGATTLPEVLRLAPNLHVARADANQYAITARGFNSVLANKMLVLVDGRTVYSPLFSGVFWEARDVQLDDVERIEVLSGAGGTLYGSNAVNGVINIITRSAQDTRGLLVSAGAGSEDRLVNMRYGARAGDTAWRVYGKRQLVDNTELTSGAPVRDSSQRNRAGFRADQVRGDTQLTVQGDFYDNKIDQLPQARLVSGGNLLGRISHDFGRGGRAQLQAYYDRSNRDQPGAINDSLQTWDIEFQHLLQRWTGHEFLWGAGWRLQDDDLTNLNPAALALLPPNRRQRLWNVFAQDEFQLADRLRFTLGLKAEHNDWTGLEWLPNARLAWDYAPNRLLWAAASRAVRTPARVDTDFFAPGILGGPNFRSEIANVFELGLRAQPRQDVSVSATLFHHRFEHLRSLDATAGGATVNNNFEARLSGVESWAQWRMGDSWRMQASYTWQKLRANAVPGSAPLRGVSSLGNDPRYRATLGASWDLGANVELDMQLRRIGALPSPAVPAYTAMDVRLGWRVRPELDLSLALRNLGGRHPEWGSPANRVEFDRGIFVKAVWKL